MREFHIQSSTSNWLIQGTQPFTAAQINGAQLTASTAQLSVESKNDQPTSSPVINWATVFGIVIALGILAMSVGLIRSETASDLRTLTADRRVQFHPPHPDRGDSRVHSGSSGHCSGRSGATSAHRLAPQ